MQVVYHPRYPAKRGLLTGVEEVLADIPHLARRLFGVHGTHASPGPTGAMA